MIYVVLVVAQVALVAYVIWAADRSRRRDTDALIALADRLCQRVQAPHAAILEHDETVRAARNDEYAPPAVAPDDDEAYWTSRDKLAELMMEQEVEANGHG